MPIHCQKKKNEAFPSEQQEDDPKLIMLVVIPVLFLYGQKQEAA